MDTSKLTITELLFCCKNCQYKTRNKYNYNRHLISTNCSINTKNKNEKYECKKCNYITINKFSYDKHLLTSKHNIDINETNHSKYIENGIEIYKCKCGNKYKYSQGLSKHKKTCNNKNNNKNKDKNKDKEEINLENFKNELLNPISIFEIIKQNYEFKELMIQQNKDFQEQNKEQLELINKFIEREPITAIYNNTNNTNNNQINNNNQKFNLNIFLNETCKDAMNVNEFLDNLNPTVKDLEDVGEKGFVRGISDIILKSLRELDVTKRPIHCTDIKREIVYLKENNIWSKDDNNNSRMKDIVRNVEDKNYFNIGKWQMEHPETRIMDSPDNLKHEKLIDVSCYAMYKEDKVRGKVIKELLKDIHVNGK